ncbi:MAG: archease [Candidatus Methanomethylophilaceae archaeon]|nr:archease [Candidatus Methanomethylophilaceae archaeon]
MDHTADMMIKAFGNTIEECFENAGFALFDQTVSLHNIRPLESKHVEVTGDDMEDMLYAYLSELLFIEDCDNIILCEFHVKIDGNKVICDAKGELLNKQIHRCKSEIKAVTYHMMDINMEEPSVTVLFDV